MRRVTHLGDDGIDLVPWQLAAFARFCPLRHLDLHYVGVDEIFGGGAEPPGGHLLDRRAHRIAVGERFVAVGLLAAFSGIRFAADPVHRDRERRVGLARDRAIGHGPGRETPHDRLGGFDVLDLHRQAAVFLRRLDAEKTADGQRSLGFLVQEGGVGAIAGLIVAARGMLQEGHRLRRPGMRFAAYAEGVIAANVKGMAIERRIAESLLLAAHGFLGDFAKPNAADPRRGPAEIALNEIFRETDRLENLGAAIGLVGRNAHFRHDLQEALVDRFDVALACLMAIDFIGKLARHGGERLEGEVGVDRFRSIARQQGEMMDLPRVAGFDDEADRGAQPLADQMMMHRRRRKEGRDRNAVGAGQTVGQDDDVEAAVDRVFGAVAESAKGIRHAFRAAFRKIGDIERLGVESLLEMPDRTDFLEVAVGQNGLPDLQAFLACIAFELEDVGARPDEGHEAHDQFLADRIDRRIGHLREILLEIGIEELRLRRQCRNRRVGAHRPDRFLAGHRHRRQQKRKILLAVAERLLAIQEQHIGARRTRMDREIHILEHDLGALQPFGIRMRGGERAFDFVVRDDAALLQIDEQHLARLQPPFGNDPLFGDRQDAGFRGQHDEPVAGDDIARRTQAIAVEHRADLAAIGKGDGGRPVPGFHHRGVIFVEGAARRIHQWVARPGFRNEHHHRMAKRIAALDEEFECIVETGRVRLAFVGDRPELAYVIAEKPGGDRGLPRRHPIEVAAQGIDFAIVRDETVGMR